MTFIADLHIHSPYSRATSKQGTLFGLAAWAAVKGIDVVATGDFTHPTWFAQMVEYLEPAEAGLYRLKPGSGCDWSAFLPPGLHPVRDPESVRFLLSSEISSIYKRGGQVRKVHNLLYAPDLDAVRRINTVLAGVGNIASDGRPILGLDSRDLLEILLEQAPEGFFVPAHIWTPWFALFGSKSGFDRIEDCFGDLTPHIFALETGLSSDPAMNRLISALDRYSLISNSDCHSPAKLGREANIFDTEYSFANIREAIRKPRTDQGRQVFTATVEFYPEEGKYHCDGHRKCDVCMEPVQTDAAGGICPQCGKPLTIGVLHRVMDLADRTTPVYPPGSPAVHSLIPLQEVVAELLDCGPATKKAVAAYAHVIGLFGSEFDLLLHVPIEDINAKAGTLLGEAISRIRSDRVIRKPGFDGEFGVIRVFADGERATLAGQGSLFAGSALPVRKKAAVRTRKKAAESAPASADTKHSGLNTEQEQAVNSQARLIMVQAGPGTGKTHTLVSRVARVAARDTAPCTVITFTNKAADEVRERLTTMLPAGHALTVATFHGYCLQQLRREEPELRVMGPEERQLRLHQWFSHWQQEEFAELKTALAGFGRCGQSAGSTPLAAYLYMLDQHHLVDLDTLIPKAVELLEHNEATAARMRTTTGHLFVDEFQDVNQVQYQLVALLARDNSVFVIGDPDQAIYGFRGADPQWFYRFCTEFAVESHQLVQNYRSGAIILHAAEQVIAHNPHPQTVLPMEPRNPGGAIHLLVGGSPAQEATRIADQIEFHLGGTSHREIDRFDATGQAVVSLKDIGILYRTTRQAEAISQVLGERGIPYQLVDMEAFYTRGNCRPLYAWILLLAGKAESEQLLWILEAEAARGQQVAAIKDRLLQQTAESLGNTVDVSSFIAECGAGEGAELAALYAEVTKGDSSDLAGLIDRLAAHYEIPAEEDDLHRFRELAVGVEQSLPVFADYLLRFSDSVLYDHRAEAVTLSTLHAAKGLEFPLVFIAGMEEGLLPLAPRQSMSASQCEAHFEEERRLFFVGMTRAITTLYLCRSRQRVLYGGPAEERQPSTFLAEVPTEAISPAPAVRNSGKKHPRHRQLSLF